MAISETAGRHIGEGGGSKYATRRADARTRQGAQAFRIDALATKKETRAFADSSSYLETWLAGDN